MISVIPFEMRLIAAACAKKGPTIGTNIKAKAATPKAICTNPNFTLG